MQRKRFDWNWQWLVRGAVLLVLALGLMACGGEDAPATAGGDGATAVSATNTPVSEAVSGETAVPAGTPTPVPATATPTIAPTPTVQTISVARLDGTVEEVPPPAPTSFNSLLDAKIASGDWTEGDGLVTLLRLFTGETLLADVPEAADVVGIGGTGIVRRAQDYLVDETSDADNRAEIERLLAALLPTQETLDLISVSAAEAALGKPDAVGKAAAQATDDSCQNLAAQSFNTTYFSGNPCYVYDEAQVNGHQYRVYYPTEWQGDDAKKSLIDAALFGLTDSASTFATFGTFEDVNLIFSLLPHPDDTDNAVTDAVQGYVTTGNACPLTMFPSSNESGSDFFKQVVAHEAFHCFQDWNFQTIPFGPNLWWLEGSAEYFSNVVYPTVNGEYGYLGQFDTASTTQSLLQMDYENFIFFQQMANELGEGGVIDLLDTLGKGGGTATALANYGDMARLFQEFVVAYMSEGIADTGGGMIRVANPNVVRVEPVDKEGEETFAVSAFVAARFRLVYEQERRFLEEGTGEGDGRHSMAEFALRQNLANWSDIPPEIRSSCREDTPYALVVTTIDDSRQFTFKATINEMEIAECDPCLLGTWDVDPDSFEAFIMRIFEQYGGGAGMPAGMSLSVAISGHDYIQFLEEGDMLTQREGFTIAFGTDGTPVITTIIDSQGSGKYSADGEAMTVSQLVDVVSRIRAEAGGVSISQTPSAGTYSFFGNTAAGPGFGSPTDGPTSTAAQYVCNEETLTITQPELGELLFNRVEKILPTPVPTPSP